MVVAYSGNSHQGAVSSFKGHRGSASVNSRRVNMKIQDKAVDSAVFVESGSPGSTGALDATTNAASLSRGAHTTIRQSPSKILQATHLASQVSSYGNVDRSPVMGVRRGSKNTNRLGPNPGGSRNQFGLTDEFSPAYVRNMQTIQFSNDRILKANVGGTPAGKNSGIFSKLSSYNPKQPGLPTPQHMNLTLDMANRSKLSTAAQPTRRRFKQM